MRIINTVMSFTFLSIFYFKNAKKYNMVPVNHIINDQVEVLNM